MRTKLMIVTAALLCVAPLARAQQAAPAAEPVGVVDLGARMTSVDGDEARYERYRDTRNGVFSRIEFGKATDQYKYAAGATNIGYRDQNYYADYTNGKAKYSAYFDSIPLNYSYNAFTPWRETQTGVFTLDSAARL